MWCNTNCAKCEKGCCNKTLCTNGDYEKYPFHTASFKKGLIQKIDDRSVGKDSLEKFRYYLKKLEFDNLDSVVKTKIVDPYCFYVKPHKFCKHTIKPYTYESKEFGIEMLELYLMYLMRDIPFSEWNKNTNPYKQLYTDFKTANPRYNLLGESIGDGESDSYPVSQFMLMPIPMWGPNPIDQKIRTYEVESGIDYLATMSAYEKLHFDGLVETPMPFNTTRYCITGRDIAIYVNKDHPGQFFDNAAIILFDLSEKNPAYLKTPFSDNKVIGFLDFGIGGIKRLLKEACLTALRSTWYHKFYLHFVLRPEEFGYNIEQNYEGYNDIITTSEILQKVKDKNGSFLLPTVYPDGSPAHPAYPSGHAAVAGAGITILKAFFKEDELIANNIPDANGANLVQNGMVKVGDELDKLATNAGIGRLWAGVHYRMDFNFGIRLGEEVAICMLTEYKKSLPYAHTFQFTRYHGGNVII